MAQCFVYMLITCDHHTPQKTYVGWTTDLKARLEKHNNGTGAKSTRGRQWRIIYYESFNNRSDAMTREYALKKDKKQRQILQNQASTAEGH